MARFYAEIQGNRGEATKIGHWGIRGHIRGWDVGVAVNGGINELGNDWFGIYSTGGSNGPSGGKLIGYVILVNGVPTFKTDRNQ